MKLSPINMKLSNIDLFNFSKSYIFFTQASNQKIITKYNLFTNEKEELELYNDYIDFRRIDKNQIIVKSNYGSIIFDNNLERIKTYFIGSPIYNFHYINYSFLQPTIFQ
jgi:hypothetical protein